MTKILLNISKKKKYLIFLCKNCSHFYNAVITQSFELNYCIKYESNVYTFKEIHDNELIKLLNNTLLYISLVKICFTII